MDPTSLAKLVDIVHRSEAGSSALHPAAYGPAPPSAPPPIHLLQLRDLRELRGGALKDECKEEGGSSIKEEASDPGTSVTGRFRPRPLVAPRAHSASKSSSAAFTGRLRPPPLLALGGVEGPSLPPPQALPSRAASTSGLVSTVNRLRARKQQQQGGFTEGLYKERGREPTRRSRSRTPPQIRRLASPSRSPPRPPPKRRPAAAAMFSRKREAPRPPAPASEEDDSREASPEQHSADDAPDRGTSSTAPLEQANRKKKRAGRRVQGPDHMQKKVDSYRQAHAHRVQRAGYVRDEIMDTMGRLAHKLARGVI